MQKPYSQACENNKQSILEVIRQYFTWNAFAPGPEDSASAEDPVRQGFQVLEIGSGTGQHAVYFAQQLPQVIWHTSDRQKNLAGINAWLEECPAANLRAPFVLDVNGAWPQQGYHGVFSANTAHIMSWPEVERTFAGVSRSLRTNGYFCLYGPFNFGGRYTSESNRNFDQMLRQRDPLSGLRDFEALQKLAESRNLLFVKQHQLPANNCLLVWRKHS